MEEERIKEIVEMPEWKSILLDLVERNEIDPWNVDIVKLSELYLREIKKFDSLTVPANALLASAILLWLKSRVLKTIREELEPEPPVEPLEEPEEYVFDVVITEELPEEVVPAKPPTRLVQRRVTLEELLSIMEKYMKRGVRRKKIEPVGEAVELFERVEEEDVESFVAEVENRIRKEADREGLVAFSRLAGNEPRQFVKTLLAVLYLANEGKVEVFQEEPFEEIFIRVV